MRKLFSLLFLLCISFLPGYSSGGLEIICFEVDGGDTYKFYLAGDGKGTLRNLTTNIEGYLTNVTKGIAHVGGGMAITGDWQERTGAGGSFSGNLHSGGQSGSGILKTDGQSNQHFSFIECPE